MDDKPRAPRNRTVTVDDADRQTLRQHILRLQGPASADQLLDRTVCQDLIEAIPNLPTSFVDLLVIDPPHNLDKSFNGTEFKSRSNEAYIQWVETWFRPLLKVLKPNASVYVCCDWRCSSSIQAIAERHLHLQNRITWEREKGRGALTNWKNCSEDIWFLTASSTYTFNVDAVKLKRRVIAPYTDSNGKPKDWNRTEDGDFRLTHPSNLWTDISIPFWSMPENTDHPTQKPEKFAAKLVLASSNPGDVVLDPFLGSGTTSVVCKKLKRHFVGIEIDETYCCLAEKRLSLAGDDPSIQGYQNGVFWDRNTLGAQRKLVKTSEADSRAQRNLFFGPETSQ